MELAHIVGILRELGLPDGPLERADSDSNEVWISPSHVVRFHGLGPPGRLAHESRVAQRLSAEALHPRVVASGWSNHHDWMVQERVPGDALSVAWPSMSVEDRRRAISEFGHALRHVHLVRPDGLIPPCLFGGEPLIPRELVVQETLRLLAEAHRDRTVLDRALTLASDLGKFVHDPPSALIHGDLNLNNVVWEGRVTGLLDFEWARAEARDVDLLSFLSFCHEAVRCVPERVQALTRREDYQDAPKWLRDVYPELFDHPNLRKRLTFYDLARWAQGLHRSTPGARFHAHDMLVDIVDGQGASDRLEW